MGAKKDGSFCDRYANEKESIKLIFHEHKGRYGYRRVIAEMHNLVVSC
ncbi:IS3 family transposase [Bacteroides caccae]|uniref:Transposase n=1 Tax=Bacteroides caccae TaxID=47678 RepID=A0A415EVK9_9BACE|nr:transposase [Bacteroides caccae]KAA2323260.1 transposase [Bacteroides caccae]KAA2330895.1 transposase [Bacteroides caccae]KAA2331658.1 transposase [Bacteroides caccae]KAA2332070.1 transposase [Bacteroides caccae]